MPQITDLLQQALTPDTISQISRQLGADEQTTKQGIDVAVPLLVSALSRNTQQYDGAEALSTAVKRDHSGGILEQPDQAINNYPTNDASKILGHILGGKRGQIESTISRGTGLDAGMLLQILAPLVMGALAKQMNNRKLDPSGLASELNQETQQYQRSNGDLMGVITNLLDTNRDGSAMDEVASMLGGMLKQRMQRS